MAAIVIGAVAGLLIACVAIERDLKRRRAWRRSRERLARHADLSGFRDLR